MRYMTVEEAVRASSGSWLGDDKSLLEEIRGMVTDSRQVFSGCAFVAVKGERVDGHSFIRQVIDQGAGCVICQHVPEGLPQGAPLLLVEDTLEALRSCAAFYRSIWDIPLVGIIGSVGKTSTKEYVAGVLAQHYKVQKTRGNLNNEIGMPLTIMSVTPEHEIAVVEMGINHFGEMSRLAAIARPDCCVFTNIGPCHLEFLGDLDGVLKAKTEVLDYMKPSSGLIINGDDERLKSLEGRQGLDILSYGLDERNAVHPLACRNLGLRGSDLTIGTPQGDMGALVTQPGEHMVRNALAATAVGLYYGLSREEIAGGIESVEPVSGRSHLISLRDMTIIDDAYNANPASMEAGLRILKGCEGYTLAILGDMGELGADTEYYHKQVGTAAWESGISGLICVGEKSRDMYLNALAAWSSPCSSMLIGHYPEVEPLLQELKSPTGILASLGRPLTVLVKASHSMGFHRIVELLVENEEGI